VQWRKNRDRFPDADLVPVWGLHVAWNAEGTRLVASGVTDEMLHQHLGTAGIDPTSVVPEFIYDPDVSYIG
jgi:hypothetical protein